jgi:hypothetical protein
LPTTSMGMSAGFPVSVEFDEQGRGDTLYWFQRRGRADTARPQPR